MDWQTPVALLGWLAVMLLGLAVGTAIVVLAVAVSEGAKRVRRGAVEPDGPGESEESPLLLAANTQTKPMCVHCGPGACPVIDSPTYKNGL